jgi:hypothetical protein
VRTVAIGVLRGVSYALFLLLATTLILFTFFELFPGLARSSWLGSVRYYAIGERYAPDPVLVFVPRETGHVVESETRGDAYRAEYGVDTQPIRFVTSYDTDGFRTSSSSPPHEIFVIGDSFIEVGETDADTLPERLARELGRATRNLGRAWYGPPQYVELLRRYVPPGGEGYTILCLFGGNDIRDIWYYREWSEGGDYYDSSLSGQGFLGRYATAMRDTWRPIRHSLRSALQRAQRRAGPGGDGETRSTHPDVAHVLVAGAETPLVFVYSTPHAPAAQLLETPEWLQMGDVLREFRDLSITRGYEPWVVYIPSKLQVYAEHLLPSSGANALREAELSLPWIEAPASALVSLTDALDLSLIDLLPVFREAASDEMLFYPFDTHWNGTGRRLAARTIASRLGTSREGQWALRE